MNAQIDLSSPPTRVRRRHRLYRWLVVGIALTWCATDRLSAADADDAALREPRPWANYVQPDFPFFSSSLDARDAAPGLPVDNLTPRGLILNLGHNCWACFDTDLLRVSAIWHGLPVSATTRPPKK